MPAIILTLIGIALVAGGITNLVRAWRTRAWPVVDGRVVARSVVESRRSSEPWTAYEPRVTYLYEVAGRSYEGHALRTSVPVYVEAKAHAVVDSLPDQVLVHYDPAHPDSAVLFVEPLSWPVVMLIGGFLATLLGLAFALSGHALPVSEW
jgi:hypothetical protein